MNSEILNRKGARKPQDIPAEVLAMLNKGEIETVNLTEWLAIDQVQLIKNNFLNLGIPDSITKTITESLTAEKKLSTMNSVKLIGSILHENYSVRIDRQAILKNLGNHVSDSIRCYAPYLISLDSKLKIEEKLDQVKAIAADSHFGVREIVWMALRPEIDKNLTASIKHLTKWTTDKNENVRRFTTEATRPRGVWCKHIDALKETPETALPLLQKLKFDDSKYVQDSVGNWLNDASKTKPSFVIELCEQWKKASPTKGVDRIIKKARRTIDKK